MVLSPEIIPTTDSSPASTGVSAVAKAPQTAPTSAGVTIDHVTRGCHVLTVNHGAQTTSATNQLMIYGLWWDLNQKASFSIDFQNLKPQSGSATAESKVLFLHGQVSF